MKSACTWPLLPLVLLTQATLLQAEDGNDYVINALRQQREARELQDKRDREAAVRAGNEQATRDAAASDSAQAHWEGQRQEQMAAENAAYYERVRRERDAAAWQAYRVQVNLKCPLERPPTFTSQTSEFAYWKARSDRDPFAALKLGYCYATGQGTAIDHDAAIAAYQKSNQNWVEVQCSIGYMLLQPDIQHPDPNQGIALLNGAAETGYIQAMFTLAACYHRGTGVAPDPVKTFMWLYACFVYPTTDGVPYLEPCYKMLSEEHDHIDAILDAVDADLKQKVIRPWGRYDQKDVFRLIAASAIHTADAELWYHYALRFPPDAENAPFEITMALCNAAEHGNCKAIYRLLATPADVSEVYASDPHALITFTGLLSDIDRKKFITVLSALPADAATVTAIARIHAGDLGGKAYLAQASEWAEKAVAVGDYRPALAICQAYQDGSREWPSDQAQAATWSSRIPETVWRVFHVPRDQAVPEKTSPYARLQSVIANHRKAIDDAAAQQASMAHSLSGTLAALSALEAHPPAYHAEQAERAAKIFESARSNEFMGFADSAPTQDLAKAFSAYVEAANLGDGWAALHVANFYAKGRAGVPPDAALAKRWRVVGRTLLANAAPFDGDLAEDFGLALIDGPDAQTGYVLTANQWLDRDVAAGIQVLQTATITNHPHAAAMICELYNGDRYPAIGIPHDEALYAAWVAIADQLLNDEDPKLRAEGLAAAKKLIANSSPPLLPSSSKTTGTTTAVPSAP